MIVLEKAKKGKNPFLWVFFFLNRLLERALLMEAILDFSTPFNPSLFDEIVSVFYTSRHPQVPTN